MVQKREQSVVFEIEEEEQQEQAPLIKEVKEDKRRRKRTDSEKARLKEQLARGRAKKKESKVKPEEVKPVEPVDEYDYKSEINKLREQLDALTVKETPRPRPSSPIPIPVKITGGLPPGFAGHKPAPDRSMRDIYSQMRGI